MSVSLKVEQNKHMVLREMLYIVEELTFMFLSRDALVNFGSISMSFPTYPTLGAMGGWLGCSRGPMQTWSLSSPA